MSKYAAQLLIQRNAVKIITNEIYGMHRISIQVLSEVLSRTFSEQSDLLV